VLLLAFAFQRDARQPVNQRFLEEAQSEMLAITIYNLMELLGQLSFNLSPEPLDAYPTWLLDAYRLTVIWPYKPDEAVAFATFRDEIFTRPFARMRAVRMPFMDALILNLAERAPNVTHFVTWNARHFQDKSTLEVLSPEAFLQR
jgi:hypothetical protein